MLRFLLVISVMGMVCAADTSSHESHCLNTLPSNVLCVANPLISKAADIVLKTKKDQIRVLDLGAGTGRNIGHLLQSGATVHAYDADQDGITKMNQNLHMFMEGKKLYTHHMRFEDIKTLPTSDLVIAWRSLSFMKKDRFPLFWKAIVDALPTHGIFVGTFFGREHYKNSSVLGPDAFRMTREDVQNLFTQFQIIDFHEILEYDQEESKSLGVDQYEHLYMILAKKKSS